MEIEDKEDWVGWSGSRINETDAIIIQLYSKYKIVVAEILE